MKKRKLKVFEAFAGIGSQLSGLKRLGVDNYEVVGVSEWYIDAILCYDAIHKNNEKVEIPSREEMLKYLDDLNISRNSVSKYERLYSYDNQMLERIYASCKRINNFGSITSLDPKIIPDTDFVVYSFPCQDLSTGGKQQGMKKGSGTRSGLLWELEKVLLSFKEQNRLPMYLLLENVPALFAEANREDLEEWKFFLSGLGYFHSDELKVSASDFGVPQRRKRAFILSKLGSKIDVKSLESKKGTFSFDTNDFLRLEIDNNPILRQEADEAQLNNTWSRVEMWEKNKRLKGPDGKLPKDTYINTITCSMDRRNTAAMFEHFGGPKTGNFRLLTIREAFLLMGFTEEEYERAKKVGLSYRKMNKLIGNSIVVNVLTEIFKLVIDDFEREIKDE